LPELANALALPATNRGQNFFGRDGVGQIVGESPAANLGAVQLEVVQAQRFRSHEVVRARRRTVQPFVEQIQNWLRPRSGVVAARGAGNP
jgi:hypothetical protein